MPMNGRVTVEIVNRIAAHEGVDPLELEPKLSDVVDPDALAGLVGGTDGRSNQETLRVNFAYGEYEVTVTGAGEITLEKRETEVGTETSEGPWMAD